MRRPASQRLAEFLTKQVHFQANMIEDKPKKMQSKLSSINDELTFRGGIKSSMQQMKHGADFLKGTASTIIDDTKAAMNPSRMEDFQSAMARLNIEEGDLPLVHNQILVQAYVTFMTFIVAVAMSVGYFLRGNLNAQLLTGVIALISLTYFAQGSLRAYQIRRRQLGILSEWIRTPSQWFASRLPGLRAMSKSDPLRQPEVVTPMAIRAQILLFVGLACFSLSWLLWYAGYASVYGPWSVIIGSAGAYSMLRGMSISFEVFKRREGLFCDLGLWMLSPLDWFPSIRDERTEALKQFDPAIRAQKASVNTEKNKAGSTSQRAQDAA